MDESVYEFPCFEEEEEEDREYPYLTNPKFVRLEELKEQRFNRQRRVLIAQLRPYIRRSYEFPSVDKIRTYETLYNLLLWLNNQVMPTKFGGNTFRRIQAVYISHIAIELANFVKHDYDFATYIEVPDTTPLRVPFNLRDPISKQLKMLLLDIQCTAQSRSVVVTRTVMLAELRDAASIKRRLLDLSHRFYTLAHSISIFANNCFQQKRPVVKCERDPDFDLIIMRGELRLRFGFIVDSIKRSLGLCDLRNQRSYSDSEVSESSSNFDFEEFEEEIEKENLHLHSHPFLSNLNYENVIM